MGLGGLSFWHILVTLVIVVLLFGTGKLRTIGSDLGGAIRGFKKALRDEDTTAEIDPPAAPAVLPRESMASDRTGLQG